MSKVVWITGVQGFIGAALSKYLSNQGVKVAGLGSGSWTDDDAREQGVDYFVSDRISENSLNALKEKSGSIPDAIYHLAGGSSVGLSFVNPEEDFINTVGSTSCVVEWIRQNAPDTYLLYASSAAVYGGGYAKAIDESAETHPYSPYGWHKRMAEMVLESYQENFNLKYISLRLFSVYGEGLCKQLIWDTCNKLVKNEGQITLGGKGDELRDWIYIDDVIHVLYKAFENRFVMPNVVNVASGTPISVADIIALVIKSWGEDYSYSFSGESRKGDPKSLVAGISLLKSLNLSPATTIETGLLKTVLWYKSYLK